MQAHTHVVGIMMAKIRSGKFVGTSDLRREDFPQPEGPTMSTDSPLCTLNARSRHINSLTSGVNRVMLSLRRTSHNTVITPIREFQQESGRCSTATAPQSTMSVCVGYKETTSIAGASRTCRRRCPPGSGIVAVWATAAVHDGKSDVISYAHNIYNRYSHDNRHNHDNHTVTSRQEETTLSAERKALRSMQNVGNLKWGANPVRAAHGRCLSHLPPHPSILKQTQMYAISEEDAVDTPDTTVQKRPGPCERLSTARRRRDTPRRRSRDTSGVLSARHRRRRRSTHCSTHTCTTTAPVARESMMRVRTLPKGAGAASGVSAFMRARFSHT